MKYDSHLALCAIILLITAGVFVGVGTTNLSADPPYSGPLCIIFGMLFLLTSVILWVYAARGPLKPVFEFHQEALKIRRDQVTKCQKEIHIKTQKDVKYQLKPSIKPQQGPDQSGKHKLEPMEKVKQTRKEHVQLTNTIV
ncbi:uncharacterized protein TNIN_156171 [Trichonephila inaurata madagascariensis]|uniref:Uncharacterized protein n=1 Tax=Trichonephila inaurata madagascariensis TaxID=2747483 RepID=A0A8X6X9D9_9ARAC|nr:uncharacterized protein TNIN_156171 [Trichonephila inaurata madagascariensis]